MVGPPPFFLNRKGKGGCASKIARAVKKVLLAAPRGYCAGVDRAIEVVRRALAHFGAPVYVRKQIVHNAHVVSELEREGACSSTRSATSRRARRSSSRRTASRRPCATLHANESSSVIDATCPLVTKVHSEATRFARAGYEIVLIGHADHEEVEGTLGEAPDATVLVETVDDALRLEFPDDAKLAYLTQTTLSVDETRPDHRGAEAALPADRRAAAATTSVTRLRTASAPSRSLRG